MPLLSHTHFRDCQEWKSQGYDLSTTSNEASKMYDATLAQVVPSYDDPALGGIEGTMAKMTAADPNFVAGIALSLGLAGQFAGKRTYNDPGIATAADGMMKLADKPGVPKWEKMQAEAINLYLNGERDKASDVLEELIYDHPLDMGSLKFLGGMYVENGYYPRLRDVFGRVSRRWTESTPFFGDFLSWYGFGLEETNYFQEAEKCAMKAIGINPNDAWAAHCVAHIREMKAEYRQGADFMERTENDWNPTMLNCHNYWHWALFKYEDGDFEAARGILDTHALPLMRKYKSPFSVTDAASLMYRLEAEGYPVEGWDDVFDVSKRHLEDAAWSYTDVNVMLACTGAKKKQERDNFVEYVRNVAKVGEKGDNARVYKEVTLPVLEAIQAYDDGEFDRAVECLKPVRYEIHKIGGSNAQRDLFNIILIESALRSNNYKKYANFLINERQSLKGDSPLMQKMLQKLVIDH